MSFKVPKKASYKYLEVNVTKCIAELTKAAIWNLSNINMLTGK